MSDMIYIIMHANVDVLRIFLYEEFYNALHIPLTIVVIHLGPTAVPQEEQKSLGNSGTYSGSNSICIVTLCTFKYVRVYTI